MHRLPTEVMEEEADEFAGEFLMPTDEVLPELQNLSIEKLSALKRRWRVSINAIVTHAHKVKAINDWQQRMIRVQLAEHGITRTQEPGELTFPIEQSFLMNELIDFHLNELGYSVNALSDSVGLHANEFLATYNPVLPAITSVPKPKLSLINSR
jgi:Zn-dependent peptidase ImmA (M78 family)